LKADRPQDRAFARTLGVVVLAAALTLGGAAAGVPGAVAGALLGLAAALGLGHVFGRRQVRLRRAVRRRFPEEWRRFLEESCDHYVRLRPSLRVRFEEDLKIFLAEARITGIGVDVTDELRLLVAASAVTLSLGWPDYDWNQLAEVLLYPDAFDRDYGFDKADLAGLAHPWGTVILSAPALEESYRYPEEPFHVGLHEFAHLLDVDHTHFDGIPVGLDDERARQWVEVMEKEMERMRRRKSSLDDYGADDPVEFLAVAVEAFFQILQEVRRRHREVYEILSAYFNQDPAAWDDERGV
jgi:Mlc titration factor MtfA (ptsG expression regulator)